VSPKANDISGTVGIFPSGTWSLAGFYHDRWRCQFLSGKAYFPRLLAVAFAQGNRCGYLRAQSFVEGCVEVV